MLTYLYTTRGSNGLPIMSDTNCNRTSTRSDATTYASTNTFTDAFATTSAYASTADRTMSN